MGTSTVFCNQNYDIVLMFKLTLILNLLCIINNYLTFKNLCNFSDNSFINNNNNTEWSRDSVSSFTTATQKLQSSSLFPATEQWFLGK